PPLVDPNAGTTPSAPAGNSNTASKSAAAPAAAPKTKEPAKAATGAPAEPATKANGLTPIEIATIPPNARVSFKDASCNTPCSLDLPKGEQHIKAELSGYKTSYQRVSVPAQMEVAIKLEASVGWLDVPGPQGATVYIDGKAWNRQAPVSIPVSPGDHTIWVIFADGHKSNEQKLNVKEDARYPLSYQ
ncbi:MAG: PEGA domain-containing protein, partial [Bryobacterales bacterium]|nr:PEGA domain-containing protein [Bryobacterales bacterium]